MKQKGTKTQVFYDIKTGMLKYFRLTAKIATVKEDRGCIG